MKSPLKSRNRLLLARENGGLEMADFNILNKALKVTWIPRLKSENVASWEIIPRAALEEGINGVNRLATKGEKKLLTTDKTRKKSPTSDKRNN